VERSASPLCPGRPGTLRCSPHPIGKGTGDEHLAVGLDHDCIDNAVRTGDRVERTSGSQLRVTASLSPWLAPWGIRTRTRMCILRTPRGGSRPLALGCDPTAYWDTMHGK
jgi:hypothetical protein